MLQFLGKSRFEKDKGGPNPKDVGVPQMGIPQ